MQPISQQLSFCLSVSRPLIHSVNRSISQPLRNPSEFTSQSMSNPEIQLSVGGHRLTEGLLGQPLHLLGDWLALLVQSMFNFHRLSAKKRSRGENLQEERRQTAPDLWTDILLNIKADSANPQPNQEAVLAHRTLGLMRWWCFSPKRYETILWSLKARLYWLH